MKNKQVINVQDTEVNVIKIDDKDYISLTDMVRNTENGLSLIEGWLRNKNTIEYLGVWEQINNPNFNSLEFAIIKNEAGTNRFTLTVKSLVIQNDPKQLNIEDSYTADIGISYAISAYQFGVSHIQTSFMNNKMNTTVISLSEDLSNSGRIKLTTLYELGFYDFASASYQNSVTTAIKPLHGMFLSIGLRTSF